MRSLSTLSVSWCVLFKKGFNDTIPGRSCITSGLWRCCEIWDFRYIQRATCLVLFRRRRLLAPLGNAKEVRLISLRPFEIRLRVADLTKNSSALLKSRAMKNHHGNANLWLLNYRNADDQTFVWDEFLPNRKGYGFQYSLRAWYYGSRIYERR